MMLQLTSQDRQEIVCFVLAGAQMMSRFDMGGAQDLFILYLRLLSADMLTLNG